MAEKESLQEREENPHQEDPNQLIKQDSIKIPSEKAFALIELQILENLEDRFITRMRKKIWLWGSILAFATVLGFTSLSSYIRATVDNKVKDEVTSKVEHQIARFENRIDQTIESGAIAKYAVEESRNKLNAVDNRTSQSAGTIEKIQNSISAYQRKIDTFQDQVNLLQKDLVKLDIITKSYYEKRRTELFRSVDSSRMIAYQIDKKRISVYLKLKDIPIDQSILVQSGGITSSAGYCLYKNIILLGYHIQVDLKKMNIFVSYTADPTKSDKVSKIESKSDGVYGDNILLKDSIFANCDYDNED